VPSLICTVCRTASGISKERSTPCAERGRDVYDGRGDPRLVQDATTVVKYQGENDPTAERFLDAWDPLSRSEQQESRAADALCDQIGICSQELLRIVADAGCRRAMHTAQTIAAIVCPSVIENTVATALNAELRPRPDSISALDQGSLLRNPSGNLANSTNHVSDRRLQTFPSNSPFCCQGEAGSSIISAIDFVHHGIRRATLIVTLSSFSQLAVQPHSSSRATSRLVEFKLYSRI